jgi:hypothetical protein
MFALLIGLIFGVVSGIAVTLMFGYMATGILVGVAIFFAVVVFFIYKDIFFWPIL